MNFFDRYEDDSQVNLPSGWAQMALSNATARKTRKMGMARHGSNVNVSFVCTLPERWFFRRAYVTKGVVCSLPWPRIELPQKIARH